MKMLPIVKKTMTEFPKSFINHLNELILIPDFNVYFGLNDVDAETDLYCKMCEWFSRDCCKAARYSQGWRLKSYWQKNTDHFNAICGTEFTIEDMAVIYQRLGNSVNHSLTVEFVESGFDIMVLEKEVESEC